MMSSNGYTNKDSDTSLYLELSMRSTIVWNAAERAELMRCTYWSTVSAGTTLLFPKMASATWSSGMMSTAGAVVAALAGLGFKSGCRQKDAARAKEAEIA